MDLSSVMAVLSPDQQDNLGSLIDAAGSCYHCANNTVGAMKNAVDYLKQATHFWLIIENHPEANQCSKKLAQCSADRDYILEIDDAFYTARERGCCDQCNSAILAARDLWTETKSLWMAS